MASGARKDRKFDSSLGGGALLDIGIYNLGFLRILTGQEPEKVETKEVHINEYGTDDYSRLALTYPAAARRSPPRPLGRSWSATPVSWAPRAASFCLISSTPRP